VPRTRSILFLVFNGLIVLFGAWSLPRLERLPALSIDLKEAPDGLALTTAYGVFPPNSVVRSVENLEVRSLFDVFYVLDRRTPDDSVLVLFESQHRAVSIQLVQYYSTLYFVSTALVALCSLITGIVVFLKRSHDRASSIFHANMVVFTLVLVIGTEQPFAGDPLWLVFLLRCVYLLAYVLLPPLFLGFVLSFPHSEKRFPPFVQTVVYGCFILLFALMVRYQAGVCFDESYESHRSYGNVLGVFYLLTSASILAGVGVLVWRYRHRLGADDRKKMRWIVWGVCMSAAPYVTLRAVPHALGITPFASEALVNLGFVFIPFSFGIAIVKEHILDIDVLINRTLVYGIMSGLVLAVYVAGVTAGTVLLQPVVGESTLVMSSIIAFVVALLFDSTKRRVQVILDRSLYRVKYDLQRALAHIAEAIDSAVSYDELSDVVLRSLRHYLQLREVHLLLDIRSGSKMWCQGGQERAREEWRLVESEFEAGDYLLAVPNATEETSQVKLVQTISDTAPIKVLYACRSVRANVRAFFALGDKGGGTVFLVQELEFLRNVVGHFRTAVERLTLQEKIILEQSEKERLEHDIRLAANIQTYLLPTTFPAIAGYTLVATNLPAQIVGGDYYDFIRFSADHWVVCIGDVSGKGLPASLLMANLQATLRSQTAPGVSPRECMQRSNRMLFESTGPDKFATLFYSILDANKNTLQFCNAGHEYPFLFNRHGRLLRLSVGGVPLGVLNDFAYAQEVVNLEKGDTLYLLSDGLPEATDERGEFFGYDRLAAVLQHYQHLPPAQLLDRSLEEVHRFAGNSPPADDMTVVVIRRE